MQADALESTVTLPHVSKDVQNNLCMVKDGLDRPLDLVLTAKLESMKSSMARPYWKKYIKDDTGNGSELSQLKRKALSLSKDLENLLKLHERQECVVADLRSKLKQLRSDGAARDRQLDLAHRTIERLSVGKDSLEAGKAASKAYIRQLESRVTGMKSVGELHTICESLQGQVHALKQELHDAEQRAVVAREESMQHDQEVQFLRRGIQLAAEQLARSSGHDISATMLMAVARGQEDAVNLSSHLAESQQQVQQMTEALAAARSHLEAQHEALLQWQDWEAGQTQKVEDLEIALQQQCAVNQELQERVEALKPAAKQARRDRDAARHHLELERTARKDAESRAQELQAELRQREVAEAVLRAEVLRMAAAQKARSRPQSAATHSPPRPPPMESLPLSAAVLVSPSRPAAPPAQVHRPAPRAADFSLDYSIAQLEKDLTHLAQNLPRAPMPAPAPPPAAAPAPLPPSQLSSPERVPREFAPAAAPVRSPQWHSNPLASPDRPLPPQDRHHHYETYQQTHQYSNSRAPSVSMSGAAREQQQPELSDEDAAWKLLEARLDQQQGEEHELMSKWQQRQAVSQDAESFETASPSEGFSNGSAAGVVEGSRRPSRLVVEVPPAAGGGAGGIPGAPSPGIASSRLLSPDLARFTTGASAEWLNGSLSLGDSLEELAAAPQFGGNKAGGRTGAGAVQVHAFAGNVPPAGVQQQGSRPAVRYSLFDLANMTDHELL